MAPFVAGSLSEDELRALCRAAYGRFGHDAVTPLVQLDHRHWLLELFHGPTLAFKDVEQLQQPRSEEHTSELQSLMRISYAVFCLKKKNILIIIKETSRQ